MPWEAPKTDWTPANGVGDDVLNRIEENIRVLHDGNEATSIPLLTPDVLGVIDPGANGHIFYVDCSSYNLRYIKSDERPAGNTIRLISYNGGSFQYGGGSPPTGDDKEIYGNGVGSGSVTWNTERMLTLTYDGSTAWHHDIT